MLIKITVAYFPTFLLNQHGGTCRCLEPLIVMFPHLLFINSLINFSLDINIYIYECFFPFYLSKSFLKVKFFEMGNAWMNVVCINIATC